MVAALQGVGAPPIAVPTQQQSFDPADAIRSDDTQRMLLGWLGWRLRLAEEPEMVEAADPAETAPVADASDGRSHSHDAAAFRRRVERRLRRWHERIAADWKAFNELDEASLHALRKRIKRQRYAVEFYSPLLAKRRVNRYLVPLAAVQERMGELNDLFVARSRYQALVANDPAAWFALGWIAARIELIRSLAKPELALLAEADPPRR